MRTHTSNSRPRPQTKNIYNNDNNTNAERVPKLGRLTKLLTDGHLHFTKTNLYFMSKRVESSSSSFSSLRGAISTRSAGVVMMSYFRVFLILLPDLWGETSAKLTSLTYK